MKNKKFIAFVVFIIMTVFLLPTKMVIAATTCDNASVSYSAHVQNIGWQGYMSDGAVAGTTGKGLRLESIKIKTSGNQNLGITYSAHVQNIGWQNNTSNDEIAGTTGRSLRLEAIKIKLTGSDSNRYDIYYRVHVQHYGWMGWTANGEAAGTTGYGYRLEAIQIKLVAKNSSAPGNTLNSFREKGHVGDITGDTNFKTLCVKKCCYYYDGGYIDFDYYSKNAKKINVYLYIDNVQKNHITYIPYLPNNIIKDHSECIYEPHDFANNTFIHVVKEKMVTEDGKLISSTTSLFTHNFSM